MHVTFSDVLLQRGAITPREAATLTLAVGRAWDRQKSMRGDVGLPDASAIALHDNGQISFLLTPGNGEGIASLSALLALLLGVDETDAPPQPVPGGLLITIAGRLGQMDLPSRKEEGFRASLVRFADENPDVLANVFWRVAGSSTSSASACESRRMADWISSRYAARRPADSRRRPARTRSNRRRWLPSVACASSPSAWARPAARFWPRKAGRSRRRKSRRSIAPANRNRSILTGTNCSSANATHPRCLTKHTWGQVPPARAGRSRLHSDFRRFPSAASEAYRITAAGACHA